MTEGEPRQGGNGEKNETFIDIDKSRVCKISRFWWNYCSDEDGRRIVLFVEDMKKSIFGFKVQCSCGRWFASTIDQLIDSSCDWFN